MPLEGIHLTPVGIVLLLGQGIIISMTSLQTN